MVIYIRTGFEKKRKGVDWCGNNTMKWLQGDQHEDDILPPDPKCMKQGPTSDMQYDDNEPHIIPPIIGDVVAVPFIDKDNNGQNFWLGKCLRVNENSTILLGWFQLIEGETNRYKMKIGASWEEVIYIVINNHTYFIIQNIKSCIYPIDVKYNEDDHTYTLFTLEGDILNAIKP